mgnify:CR=1 FL=1
MNTTNDIIATTTNILDAYEQDQAERNLPPDGTWPGVLYSWEKRTTMPDWHPLRNSPTYNLRFTLTADRDYTVFAEATTDIIKTPKNRLHMACVLAAQVLKLGGVTKERYAAASDKDALLEQYLDQMRVTPLTLRGNRSKKDDSNTNGQPRKKQRYWINEITRA